MARAPGIAAAIFVFFAALPATAGVRDDLAICRKTWWGSAHVAACSRVLAATDADDLARAEASYWRARGLLNAQYSKLAFSDLAESLRLAPWNAETIRYRAHLHKQAGDLKASLVDFTAALELARSSDTLAARAEVHEALGDGAKAIADLTAALELAPDTARLMGSRARIHLKRGDALQAIADFNAMFEATDDSLTKHAALASRAEARLALGDYAQAVADATAAIALHTKGRKPLVTRAEALLHLNDAKSAAADLDQAIGNGADSALAHRLRAWARLEAGEFQGAWTDVLIADVLTLDDPDVLKLRRRIVQEAQARGLVLGSRSDEEAYALCLKGPEKLESVAACQVLITSEGFPEARKGFPLSIRGRFLYKEASYALAAASLQAAIDNGQKTDANYTFLGYALQSQERFDEAIAVLSDVVFQRPSNVLLLKVLAGIEERAGRCDAATKHIVAAIRGGPDQYLYSALGRCLSASEDYATAAKAYGAAVPLEKNPGSKIFLLELQAEALAAAGDYETALGVLGEALRLKPDDPSIRQSMAEGLLMRGDLPAAIALLTKAIAAEPKSTHLVALRARAYMQAGNLDAALLDADTAVAAVVSQPAWYVVRAEVRLARKDYAGARKDIDIVLAANPFSFEARAILAELDRQ